MLCVNRVSEDILMISQIEDTCNREFGEIIEYYGEKFIVYYITNDFVQAVKVTDKRKP